MILLDYYLGGNKKDFFLIQLYTRIYLSLHSIYISIDRLIKNNTILLDGVPKEFTQILFIKNIFQIGIMCI